MKIHTIPVGPFQANCIIFFDEKTKQGVVVDPGDEPKKIIEQIRKDKLSITHILLTHAHIDHIMGLKQVQEACQAEVWLHKHDEPLFVNSCAQAQALGVKWKDNLPTVNHYLEDQNVLTCGSLNIRVIHTPGHSAGSVCFFVEDWSDPTERSDLKVLLTGDTLFAGSVGRTDLWGGKAYQLKASLKKLTVFPSDTRVIPGHGPETTIGQEKEENPYFSEQLN